MTSRLRLLVWWVGLLSHLLLTEATAYAAKQRRLAVVIGNSCYRSTNANCRKNHPRLEPKADGWDDLMGPSADAKEVGEKLRMLGFEVMDPLYDADRKTIRAAIINLADAASKQDPKDLLLFFFAGHGLSHQGTNYLVPRDMTANTASWSKDDYDDKAINIKDDIISRIASNAAESIFIFNNCQSPTPTFQGFYVHNLNDNYVASYKKPPIIFYSAPSLKFSNPSSDPDHGTAYGQALANSLANGEELRKLLQSVYEKAYGITVQEREIPAEDMLTEEKFYLSELPGSQPSHFIRRKFALVLANSDYKDSWGYINGPLKDAELVSEKLRQLGFRVIVLTNFTKQSLLAKLFTLTRNLGPTDLVVMYYSGLGYAKLASDSYENMIIPINAEFQSTPNDKLSNSSVSISKVLDEITGNGSRTIVFLNSCKPSRVRGFERFVRPSRNEEKSDNHYFILYSTAYGQMAYANELTESFEKTTMFTSSLLKYIGTKDKKIEDIVPYVEQDIIKQRIEKHLRDRYAQRPVFDPFLGGSAIYLGGKTPLYGKWWVWVSVGGAVATLLGIGLSVGLRDNRPVIMPTF